MASLASMGQQLPLIVVRSEEPGRYLLVDGYKRVRVLLKLRRGRALAMVWELEQTQALVLEQLMRRGESDGAIHPTGMVAGGASTALWTFPARVGAALRQEPKLGVAPPRYGARATDTNPGLGARG